MNITPDYISQLPYEGATLFQISQLVNLSKTCPDDVLRSCAQAWIRTNAVNLVGELIENLDQAHAESY